MIHKWEYIQGCKFSKTFWPQKSGFENSLKTIVKYTVTQWEAIQGCKISKLIPYSDQSCKNPRKFARQTHRKVMKMLTGLENFNKNWLQHSGFENF